MTRFKLKADEEYPARVVNINSRRNLGGDPRDIDMTPGEATREYFFCLFEPLVKGVRGFAGRLREDLGSMRISWDLYMSGKGIGRL